MFLEDLTIPQGARLKGTSILQPKDLMALFTHDTTNMCGKKVFDEYDLTINENQYVLIGSTIKSYLSYLQDEDKIEYEFSSNKMFWKQK